MSAKNTNNNSFKSSLPRLLSLKKRRSTKRSTSTATSSVSEDALPTAATGEADEIAVGTLSSSSINNNNNFRSSHAIIAQGGGGGGGGPATARSQRSPTTAGSENVFFQFNSSGDVEKSTERMDEQSVQYTSDDNDFELHYAVIHDEVHSPPASPHFMSFGLDVGGGGGELVGESSTTTTFHDDSSVLRIIQPVAAAATIDECITAKVKVVSPAHSAASSSAATTKPQKLEFSKAVPVRVLNYFWSRGKRSAASFRNRGEIKSPQSPQPTFSATFDEADQLPPLKDSGGRTIYRSLRSQANVIGESTHRSIEVRQNQSSFGSSFDNTIPDIDDEDSMLDNRLMLDDNMSIKVPKPDENADEKLHRATKSPTSQTSLKLAISPPQRRRAADTLLDTAVVPPALVSPLARSPVPGHADNLSPDSSTSKPHHPASRRKPLHKWIASSFHKLSRADSSDTTLMNNEQQQSIPTENRKPPSLPSKFRHNSETNSVAGASSVSSAKSGASGKTATIISGSIGGGAEPNTERRNSTSSSHLDAVSETYDNVGSTAKPHHEAPATAAVQSSSSAKKSAHRFFFRSGRASKVLSSGISSSGSSPPTPIRGISVTPTNAAHLQSAGSFHQFKHSPLSPIPSNEPLSTVLLPSQQQQEENVAEIGLDVPKADDHHDTVVATTSSTTVISLAGDVNSPDRQTNSSPIKPKFFTVSPLATAVAAPVTTSHHPPQFFSFPSRSSNQNSSFQSEEQTDDDVLLTQPVSGVIPPAPPSPPPSSALTQLAIRPQKAKSLDDEAIETRIRSSTTTTSKSQLRAKTVVSNSSSKTSHHRHHNSSPGGKITPFVAAVAKRLTGGNSSTSSSTSNVCSPEPFASPTSPQPPSTQSLSRTYLFNKSSTPPSLGQLTSKPSSPALNTTANVPNPTEEMLTTKNSSKNLLLNTAAPNDSDLNTVGVGDLSSVQRRASNVGAVHSNGGVSAAAATSENSSNVTTENHHFSLSADNATIPVELTATTTTLTDEDGNKRSVSVDNNDVAAPEKTKDPQEAAKVMREYKILELVQTEKDYVEDLRKIVEGYMEEMKQHPPPDDMQGKEKIIFGNIAQIFEWHRDTFSKQIEQNAQQPDKLAQLFERHFRRLLMYVTYCQNKPKSDCVVSEYLDSYFEELRKRLGHRLTLPDLLIKPVQRPMRYELLLKEMAKYTARAGLDAAPFEKAIDLISQGICKLVDDSMEVGRLSGFDGNLNAQGKLLLQETFQVADASQLTAQLHASATSSSLVPSPNSSSRGSSTHHQRVDSSKCEDRLKFQERRLFLFEQILIVSEVQYIGAHNTASSGKQLASNLIKAFYIYKDHIQVNKLSLIDDLAPHRFVVLMRDPHAGEKCYVVTAGDDAKRDLWVTKIRQMLDTQTNFLRALQSPIDFQRRTQSFN